MAHVQAVDHNPAGVVPESVKVGLYSGSLTGQEINVFLAGLDTVTEHIQK